LLLKRIHHIQKRQFIDTTVNLEAFVDSTATGLGETIDGNGGVIFDYHSEANAVAAILNGIHTEAVATSKLNIEVITEYSTLEASLPIDALVDPTSITLVPSPGFIPVPGVIYDAEEADTINIDYSVRAKNDGLNEHYSSNGKLTISTNKDLGISELVDENSVTSNVGNDISFEAVYLPGTDEIRLDYTHNFNVGPDPVLLTITTKRWLSF
jgi:hypothetical protein